MDSPIAHPRPRARRSVDAKKAHRPSKLTVGNPDVSTWLPCINQQHRLATVLCKLYININTLSQVRSGLPRLMAPARVVQFSLARRRFAGNGGWRGTLPRVGSRDLARRTDLFFVGGARFGDVIRKIIAVDGRDGVKNVHCWT